MPIYEYKCKNCGEIFDKFQSLGASSDNIACPKCNSLHPDRIFSAFSSSGISSSSASGMGCASSGPFT